MLRPRISLLLCFPFNVPTTGKYIHSKISMYRLSPCRQEKTLLPRPLGAEKKLPPRLQRRYLALMPALLQPPEWQPGFLPQWAAGSQQPQAPAIHIDPHKVPFP